MNSLRKFIRQTLSEAHYTTWKKIEPTLPAPTAQPERELDESSPIDTFQGQQQEIIQKLAKHFKIGKVAPLGSGTSGFAYYIPNNQVLKVTKNKSEVAEAKKIQGHKCKHLANIYGTYTLQGKFAGTYVVISELLDKSEDIDEAEHLFFHLLKDMKYMEKLYFNSPNDLFKRFSLGMISEEEIKQIQKDIKTTLDSHKSTITLWYFNGMLGIIDELDEYQIKSKDWGANNLGIKKNGSLAMYDLGYGDTNVPDSVENIHLNEKQLSEYLAANEYPEFTDGQFNPLFKDRAYLPTMNMNTAPLAEDTADPEELQKLQLPMQYDFMWGDFIQSLGDNQIMPCIGQQAIGNTNTEVLVKDLAKNHPDVYKQFADFIYSQMHGNIEEALIGSEELNKKNLPLQNPQLLDDFIQAKSEMEVREIAPDINLRQAPEKIIQDMQAKYPSLYDTFADWIFNKQKL